MQVTPPLEQVAENGGRMVMDGVCKAQGKAVFPLIFPGVCQQNCSMGLLVVTGHPTTHPKWSPHSPAWLHHMCSGTSARDLCALHSLTLGSLFLGHYIHWSNNVVGFTFKSSTGLPKGLMHSPEFHFQCWRSTRGISKDSKCLLVSHYRQVKRGWYSFSAKKSHLVVCY